MERTSFSPVHCEASGKYHHTPLSEGVASIQKNWHRVEIQSRRRGHPGLILRLCSPPPSHSRDPSPGPHLHFLYDRRQVDQICHWHSPLGASAGTFPGSSVPAPERRGVPAPSPVPEPERTERVEWAAALMGQAETFINDPLSCLRDTF